MIARIAARAICRPKLDETVVAPGAVVVAGPQRARDLRQLVAAERFRPDLEALVAASAGGRPAPLDDGVGIALRAHHLANVSGRVRHGRLEAQLRAALEVDTEIEPAYAERDGADEDDHGRDPEPDITAAHEVDLQPPSALLPWAPMNRGLLNHEKPASIPSIARVAATAVTREMIVPIRSIRAKPFTCAVATANSTRAVIAVTTFASTMVWKPFAYPPRSPRARTCPRAPLP